MGIRNWFFKGLSDNIIRTAGIDWPYPAGSSSYVTSYSGYTYGEPKKERILPGLEQFTTQAYLANPTIRALIDARIRLFSEARFQFRNLNDKHLFGSSALSKLEKPWVGGTTGDLLAKMEQHVSLAGNAFVRDCGDHLEVLRPDWVTIVSDVVHDEYGFETRVVVGYLYEPVGDPERTTEFYPEQFVAHWAPTPDPLAPTRGVSWLQSVIRELYADNSMSAHRNKYYENAATPNAIIKHPKQLTYDQAKDLVEKFDARHQGVVNAYKTGVLTDGADFEIVGNVLDDGFAKVQSYGEVRLASAAGVPPIVASLQAGLDASTMANYDAAMQHFADLTIRPNWRSACAALAKLVEVPQGSELWYDTTDIAALQTSEKRTADVLRTQAATVNDLFMQGFEWNSIILYVSSGDVTKLKHTGLLPVQVQQPNGANANRAPAVGGNEEPTSGTGNTNADV